MLCKRALRPGFAWRAPISGLVPSASAAQGARHHARGRGIYVKREPAHIQQALFRRILKTRRRSCALLEQAHGFVALHPLTVLAALALYRLREATPYRKHEETPSERSMREARECQAIEAALAMRAKWPGWPLTEVGEIFAIPLPTLYSAHDKKLIPSRKIGKTVIINLNDPLWYRWYASGRSRDRAIPESEE